MGWQGFCPRVKVQVWHPVMTSGCVLPLPAPQRPHPSKAFLVETPAPLG